MSVVKQCVCVWTVQWTAMCHAAIIFLRLQWKIINKVLCTLSLQHHLPHWLHCIFLWSVDANNLFQTWLRLELGPLLVEMMENSCSVLQSQKFMQHIPRAVLWKKKNCKVWQTNPLPSKNPTSSSNNQHALSYIMKEMVHSSDRLNVKSEKKGRIDRMCCKRGVLQAWNFPNLWP